MMTFVTTGASKPSTHFPNIVCLKMTRQMTWRRPCTSVYPAFNLHVATGQQHCLKKIPTVLDCLRQLHLCLDQLSELENLKHKQSRVVALFVV